MADLDGGLQGGRTYATTRFRSGRVSLDGILLGGRTYDEEYSQCTCVALTPTPTIHTVGITAYKDHLDIQFSTNVVLSGPALDTSNWYITVSGPGRDVNIGTVAVISADTVRVTVTAQTLDANYTLHFPTLGITSDVFGIFTGLYGLEFEGVPTIVTVQMVRTIDARTVEVLFGIPVDKTTASDPLNYSVNNGLEVTASVRVTDTRYRLTTTRQTNDVIYTFVASNIEPK